MIEGELDLEDIGDDGYLLVGEIDSYATMRTEKAQGKGDKDGEKKELCDWRLTGYAF